MNNEDNGLGDKIYAFLALLGFVFLCVVYVFNRSSAATVKPFDIGGYYIPKDTINQNMSAAEQYQLLLGGRTIQCPQTSMTATKDNLDLSKLFTSYSHSRYGVSRFFLTKSVIGTGDTVTKLDDIGNVINQCDTVLEGQVSLVSFIKDASNVPEYAEIVAPFSFVFGSTNTVDKDKIVIYNGAQTCRITFNNVANWFCAGTYGTTTTAGSGTEEDQVDWTKHGNYHHTVIGNTKAATITSGSAGDVIGYARLRAGNGALTTVSIEVLDGNSWKNVTVKQWLATE